ncbi:MAG: hypothetical protein IJC18_03955, partial [Clostridia bacterium]|nr:hypothetical protein [Clostridia bacterium]
MLSMLEILPPKERNLLGRCWRYIFRPPTEGKIDSAGSVPFVRIYSEESRHGHDWRMIEAHNLDPSGRMLMPIGLDFPQGCGVR